MPHGRKGAWRLTEVISHAVKARLDESAKALQRVAPRSLRSAAPTHLPASNLAIDHGAVRCGSPF